MKIHTDSQHLDGMEVLLDVVATSGGVDMLHTGDPEDQQFILSMDFEEAVSAWKALGEAIDDYAGKVRDLHALVAR